MSPNVGSTKKFGPICQGVVSCPPSWKWWAMIPWWIGKAPVPIVAWSWAVEVGDEPT
jgi:hypothetical protein